MLLADRGYDADWIRELASQKGAWANILPKRNRKTIDATGASLARIGIEFIDANGRGEGVRLRKSSAGKNRK